MKLGDSYFLIPWLPSSPRPEKCWVGVQTTSILMPLCPCSCPCPCSFSSLAVEVEEGAVDFLFDNISPFCHQSSSSTLPLTLYPSPWNQGARPRGTTHVSYGYVSVCGGSVEYRVG